MIEPSAIKNISIRSVRVSLILGLLSSLLVFFIGGAQEYSTKREKQERVIDEISRKILGSIQLVKNISSNYETLFWKEEDILAEDFRALSNSLINKFPALTEINYSNVLPREMSQRYIDSRKESGESSYELNSTHNFSYQAPFHFVYPRTPRNTLKFNKDLFDDSKILSQLKESIETGRITIIRNENKIEVFKPIYSGRMAFNEKSGRWARVRGVLVLYFNPKLLFMLDNVSKSLSFSINSNERPLLKSRVEEKHSFWDKIIRRDLEDDTNTILISRLPFYFLDFLGIKFVAGFLSSLVLAFLSIYSFLRVKQAQVALNQINKDISREVEKKTEFIEKQQGQLLHSSKLATIGEMAGGVAHEINNPLAIIAGNCTRLKKLVSRNNEVDRDKNNEKVNEAVDKIEDTVKRISTVTNALLAMSHGSSEIDKTTMFLTKAEGAVDKSLAIASEKFQSHGIRVEKIGHKEDWETLIKVNPNQIAQIISNFLNNSFDSIKDSKEPWVRVSIKKRENILEICISDSGEGVPEDLEERIFDAYFTTKELGDGTGLGLSLSASMARVNNGKLSYDRSDGVTNFRLQLELNQKEEDHLKA